MDTDLPEVPDTFREALSAKWLKDGIEAVEHDPKILFGPASNRSNLGGARSHPMNQKDSKGQDVPDDAQEEASEYDPTIPYPIRMNSLLLAGNHQLLRWSMWVRSSFLSSWSVVAYRNEPWTAFDESTWKHFVTCLLVGQALKSCLMLAACPLVGRLSVSCRVDVVSWLVVCVESMMLTWSVGCMVSRRLVASVCHPPPSWEQISWLWLMLKVARSHVDAEKEGACG